MAKSFKKRLNTFYKIAGIIVAIVSVLSLINEFSSSDEDTYENFSGISIIGTQGDVNIGDIYNYEGEVEVKNTINNVYNIISSVIEEQETFGPEADYRSEDVEPLDKDNILVNDESHITNSIGMEFIKIPGGEFMMGSPSDETYREADEGPVHKVTIEEPFYLSKSEVTQEQWEKVMENNPSRFKGDDLPVENVSLNDIQDFVDKLNEMEDTDKYRLPSEAEWEYSCRADTITKYFFGDDESKLGDYAWYFSNSNNETHPVGQKKPNPWGLYDMHGNVWEWVQDGSHDSYYGAPSDGSAWGSGEASRGGSFYTVSRFCRSANRNGCDPEDTIGFRLVREL